MVKMIKNLYTLISSNVEIYGSGYMNRFLVRSVPEYKRREKKHGMASWPTMCGRCGEEIIDKDFYGALESYYENDFEDLHFSCLLERIKSREIIIDNDELY